VGRTRTRRAAPRAASRTGRSGASKVPGPSCTSRATRTFTPTSRSCATRRAQTLVRPLADDRRAARRRVDAAAPRRGAAARTGESLASTARGAGALLSGRGHDGARVVARSVREPRGRREHRGPRDGLRAAAAPRRAGREHRAGRPLPASPRPTTTGVRRSSARRTRSRRAHSCSATPSSPISAPRTRTGRRRHRPDRSIPKCAISSGAHEPVSRVASHRRAAPSPSSRWENGAPSTRPKHTSPFPA